MFNDPRTRPLLRAFVQQLAWLFFLGTFILDEGVLHSAARAPSIGFWSGVMLVLIRRPHTPTRGDLLFIRWGLHPIMLIGLFVQIQVWKATGKVSSPLNSSVQTLTANALDAAQPKQGHGGRIPALL